MDKLKFHIQQQFLKQKNFTLEYAEFVALKTMLPIKDWEEENENASEHFCLSFWSSSN